MADASPPLKITEQQGVTIAQFTDKRITEPLRIAEIQRALETVVDTRPRPLILIDFYNIDYFSSAALSMLISLNTRTRERTGQLRLCNILPQIAQVFALTNLDKVLRISSTRTGALNVLTRIAQDASADSP